jgi:hypothetical protein
MITVTIGDILTGASDEREQAARYNVYVVYDGTTCFYVGQTRDWISGRIFSHLGQGAWGVSWLGQWIKANAPDSLTWKVDMLTIEDCQPTNKHWDRRSAEQAIIKTRCPCLNRQRNPHARRPPAQYVSPFDGRSAAAMHDAMDRLHLPYSRRVLNDGGDD